MSAEKHDRASDLPLINRIFLAVLASAKMFPKPAWLFLVGSPSMGSSQLLKWLFERPEYKEIVAIKKVSEPILISGSPGANDLLPKLNKKTLVLGDVSKETFGRQRQTVMAILRDTWDGPVRKAFRSSPKPKEYNVSFALIATGTQEMLHLTEPLGERRLVYVLGDTNKLSCQNLRELGDTVGERMAVQLLTLGTCLDKVSERPTGPGTTLSQEAWDVITKIGYDSKQ